jgi:hypothetical protein
MKRSRFSMLLFCFVAFAFLVSAAAAQVLKITSKPGGAKVEIDGVAVGTTPYEVKLPGDISIRRTLSSVPGSSSISKGVLQSLRHTV